jgi:hypothetical protein
MALTGKQVLSMTPEQIAEMMTDDISVNNGLRTNRSQPKPPPRCRHRTQLNDYEFNDRGYLTEQIKAMRAELARSAYGAEIPTRVSILPKSSYENKLRLPAKKVIAEHREPNITSSLGKRKIKI